MAVFLHFKLAVRRRHGDKTADPFFPVQMIGLAHGKNQGIALFLQRAVSHGHDQVGRIPGHHGKTDHACQADAEAKTQLLSDGKIFPEHDSSWKY